MGECNTSCDDEKGKCEDGKTESSGCDVTDEVMGLADEAWEELMKEKMKAELEKAVGSRMNAIAAAGVAASMEYWESVMQNKAKCEEHKEKIRKAFMG